MWLIGNLKPDFKTIADFRRDNKQQIKATFQKFSMICSEHGLIGKEIVAVDGSKFRASNSRLAYHTEKKIDEKIKYHKKSAEQYLKFLDSCDSEEKSQPKYTKQELTEKIDHINKRIDEFNALKNEVVKNGTIYDTDKDSRMMRMNNNGADICHNVQIAVDDKNHMVVAVDVTSQPIDKEQLYNMASQAKENMQVDEMTVIADKGYYSASQFKQCDEDGITSIVSKASQSFHSVTNDYNKDEFRFDEEQDGYICPGGALLLPFSKGKDGCIKYANTKACLNCPQKSSCTKGKYRMVQDRPFVEYARAVDERTKGNMEMYHKRKQLAEHPFGTVKRGLGFTYFLTRGTESVKAESCMHFLIYNIKRAMNVVGKRELMVALRG